METEKNKNINRLASVLAIIIILSVSFNFIQFYRKNNYGKSQSIFFQNELFRSEVRKSRIEINKYKGITNELDQIVKEANEEIAKKENKIYKLLSQNTNLQKENVDLKNEIKEIKEIKEVYLEEIDSVLLEVNLNKMLTEKIGEMEDVISELNYKLGLASGFTLDNIEAITLKEKVHGQAQKTALAKKTKVINVCFDLLENKLIKKDYYDIYIQIINPKSEILIEDNNATNIFKDPVTKKKAAFSATKVITYNNEKLHNCIRFHPNEDLMIGVYLVEIYTNTEKIGTTTFTLK